MVYLYTFFIFFYRLAILAASPFKRKARLWIKGRKGLLKKIENQKVDNSRVIWFHCSSLGEFEQGRPLIEEIRKRNKNFKILLTFFSPSGYEIRKNYSLADYVHYLPLDSRMAAARFISHFNPVMAVFIKYEFWYFYIQELYKRGIPLYLVSAVFRPAQVFFKKRGKWFRDMLSMFAHIYVQNDASEKLLKEAGIENVTVAGDTRFDRVCTIASESKQIPLAEEFSHSRKVLVAGSTWKADEEIIADYINNAGEDKAFIIAPHEIDSENINRLMAVIKKPAVKYSALSGSGSARFQVLVIDNIGLLSSLYRYGSVAYIGGGFGNGIHNILEAAVYGMPVIFGPGYKKFAEAVELVRLGGAFPVNGESGLTNLLDRFFSDQKYLEKTSAIAHDFVKSGEGATHRIIHGILPELP